MLRRCGARARSARARRTYDRVMAEEHRTAVLITPERVYSSS